MRIGMASYFMTMGTKFQQFLPITMTAMHALGAQQSGGNIEGAPGANRFQEVGSSQRRGWNVIESE